MFLFHLSHNLIVCSCLPSDLDEEVASDILNRNLSFLSGLKRILNDGGILVFNAGSDVRAVDSKTTAHSTSREVSTVQSTLSKSLAELGFIHVKQYNDNLAAYPNPKAFVVAFSDDDTAKNWNRNEAQINRIIRDRTLSTKSGDTLFKLFDGSTMVSYSRFEQYVDNCNTHPDPRWCDINRQLMVAKASLNQLPQEMRSFDTCKETPNTSDSNASCNGLAHCNRNQPSDGNRWSTNNRIDRSQFIGMYESSQSHHV